MSYQIRDAFWIWFWIRPVWHFRAHVATNQTTFFPLHKSDGFKLQYRTHTRWHNMDMIVTYSISSQVNLRFFSGVTSGDLKDSINSIPSDFPHPVRRSAWWKTSKGPFCDSNFQLLPPLVRTTKERRALGTNLGTMDQHRSMESDGCCRKSPHIFIYFFDSTTRIPVVQLQ